MLCALVLVARPALAQIDGLVTPFVGGVSGGDATATAPVFGVSVAALEIDHYGAEIDLSHSGAFLAGDDESDLTTAMANLLIGRPTGLVRPYGVAGVGLIRTRGCSADCLRESGRTDFGWNAGGGAYIRLATAWLLRGDLRYFRYAATHDDLPATDAGPFDFWRTSVGVTFSWSIQDIK